MCYKYALVNDLDGVWGNTTRAQRDNLPLVMKNIFIEEARQQGYLETFAAPTAPRHITRVVVIRDEFIELSEEVLERSDFTVEYFYKKYVNRVERLITAIEESILPT